MPIASDLKPKDRTVTIDGLRFHYLDWGNPQKPLMVLLHGGLQTGHSWDEVSRALSGDYHILALDQRGHGDSDWAPDGDYSLDAHLRDIHGFVEGLGLKPFLLMGLSMGGRNAICYTALHPDRVRALVIVDIGPETMREGRENIRRFTTSAEELESFDAFVERAHKFNPRRSLENLRERLQWNLKQLPNGKWTWKYDKRFRTTEFEQARGRVDLWPYVRRIQCPTILVRGALSDVLSGDAAKKVVDNIRNCQYAVVEKAGHTVMGDNPEGFLAAVRPFLEGLKARRA
ncbi:MAG: alpha/beta hydrolase [Chloroflexi bacterium]|nr:alpha/beta hydrolase [Chloroflexota bacterium]